MISQTIRSYEVETDLQAISDLLKACAAVDKLNQDVSVSELQQTSDNPSLDKVHDIRLWEDPDGKLIGIGHLDLVMIAPDGTFAGCCECTINPESNLHTGHNEG